MMSAPRSARLRVQIGPAQPIEKSTTRTPSSGSRFGSRGLLGRDDCAAGFAASVASPSAGTLPPRRGGVPVSRCAEPIVTPRSAPISIGTIAPRERASSFAISCAMLGTGTSDAPFQTLREPFGRCLLRKLRHEHVLDLFLALQP